MLRGPVSLNRTAGSNRSSVAKSIEETRVETQTVRRRIMALLVETPCTVREISQALSISEKEVYKHLPHVARSVAAGGRRLAMVPPPQCRDCGFKFEDRSRYTRPSRCPRCKGEHVEQPVYRIV